MFSILVLLGFASVIYLAYVGKVYRGILAMLLFFMLAASVNGVSSFWYLILYLIIFFSAFSSNSILCKRLEF